jgi:hypothetical protein
MVYLIDAIGMGKVPFPAELPMWEQRRPALAGLPDVP